jgi:hypothetical protein
VFFSSLSDLCENLFSIVKKSKRYGAVIEVECYVISFKVNAQVSAAFFPKSFSQRHIEPLVRRHKDYKGGIEGCKFRNKIGNLKVALLLFQTVIFICATLCSTLCGIIHPRRSRAHGKEDCFAVI